MVQALQDWMKARRMHWLTLVTHAGVILWALLHLVLYIVENPIDEVDWLTSVSGHTGLNLLLLSLACTPLYIITGWSPIIRVRRPLGLYGFAFIVMHFIIFVTLFHAFYWTDIFSDILGRNIYRAGFGALVLMLPLAITSTQGWQRRLRKNWSRLHKLMYIIVILGALHYIWVDKRPNLLTLLTEGQLDVLFGQLLTKSYFRMELVVLMLAVRLPPVRQAIVRMRRNRFPPKRKGSGSRRPPTRVRSQA